MYAYATVVEVLEVDVEVEEVEDVVLPVTVEDEVDVVVEVDDVELLEVEEVVVEEVEDVVLPVTVEEVVDVDVEEVDTVEEDVVVMLIEVVVGVHIQPAGWVRPGAVIGLIALGSDRTNPPATVESTWVLGNRGGGYGNHNISHSIGLEIASEAVVVYSRTLRCSAGAVVPADVEGPCISLVRC